MTPAQRRAMEKDIAENITHDLPDEFQVQSIMNEKEGRTKMEAIKIGYDRNKERRLKGLKA